ncbi:MAG: threonine/homoserine/homoserine lactone efflux protein [Paracoccaceae bacterium]
MTLTLTLTGILLYAGALVALFMTPGPVWLALISRTLTHGLRAAVPLVLGVAIGDSIWSITAILGISWLAAEHDWIMVALRILAVVVFAGMGLLLIVNAAKTIDPDSRLNRPGLWAGFIAGLAAILANPKAVIFYVGMLPSFFDLRALTTIDVVIIAGISMGVPFICNLSFAYFVDRARRLITSPHAMVRTNRISGALLIGVAVVIAFTAL